MPDYTMITHVDIRLLPKALRENVLKSYALVLREPATKLNYREAAWLYGYTYATIRHYTSRGTIKAAGHKSNRTISHAAMRSFLAKRKQGGRPRQALKDAQGILL